MCLKNYLNKNIVMIITFWHLVVKLQSTLQIFISYFQLCFFV